MKLSFRTLLILLLPLATGANAGAADNGIVVVISSNLRPYQEATSGIKKELGGDVASFVLTDGAPQVPSGTRAVIAIGGKAALFSYPGKVRVIYCLAPGLNLSAKGRPDAVRVETSPPLSVMVARIKEIQPALKRLGVLWASESVRNAFVDKEKVRAVLGVEIVGIELESAEDLPRTLREVKGSVNALWLPPDPQLVTEPNLATIKGFSWANDIPFYAPTAALVDRGAVAAISSSFEEMGRAAAKTAKAVVSGTSVPGTVYPEKIQTTVNLAAAKEVGLTVPPAVVSAANGVAQ